MQAADDLSFLGVPREGTSILVHPKKFRILENVSTVVNTSTVSDINRYGNLKTRERANDRHRKCSRFVSLVVCKFGGQRHLRCALHSYES